MKRFADDIGAETRTRTIIEDKRPKIPSRYRVSCEQTGKDGEDVVRFVSPQHNVTLKGRSLGAFVQHVAPLLDGRHTISEIHAHVSESFSREDLDTCLTLLSVNGVLEDSSKRELAIGIQERLHPQLNAFQELSLQPIEFQDRLARACVAVLGLTGAGTAAARSVVAAGIGELRCIDDGEVRPADMYFSPEFTPRDRGSLRCDAIRRHLRQEGANVILKTHAVRLPDEAAIEERIAGCDFVVNCTGEEDISLVHKLNRVCWRNRIPWTSATASGLEVVIGPTVYPGETACYLCYRMRLLACADDPEISLDFESSIGLRKTDDAVRRGSLVFGATIAGQLAGMEVLKALTQAREAVATRGRIWVLDLRDLSSTMHPVLRKPWCPACFENWDEETRT